MPQGNAAQAPPTPPPPPESFRLSLKQAELRDQLKELSQRRNALQEQRAGMSSARGAELEARIAVIDARSAKLEADLFATNDQIARGLSASDGRTTAQEARDSFREDLRSTTRNTSRSVGIGIASVLAIVIMWRAVKSFFPRDRRPESLADNSAQLAQLQQSLDAIAVEVERISEAQRYAAKLMNERGIGAGAAQPVAVPAPSAANVPLGQSAAAKSGR